MRRTEPKRRLSYANVAATLALCLALAGGSAWAAGKLGPRDIAKNAIRSKHIKRDQVKPADTSKGVLDVCAPGTLAAMLRVNADPSFSSALTTEGVFGSACRGAALVQRTAEGNYRICLPQVLGSTDNRVVASSEHEAGASVGSDNLVTVRRFSETDECGTLAEVRSVDSSSGDLEDADFTVLIAVG